MRMKRGFFGVATAALLALTVRAQAGKPTPDADALIGDWRGDSICVVQPSACRAEKALYRIKKNGDSPNYYSIDADKIVDGKPVFMGTVDCTYAPDKHALTCSSPKLLLHLTLEGKSLTGTMRLPDGTLWRNITLRHD